jgi:transposase-like protein
VIDPIIFTLSQPEISMMPKTRIRKDEMGLIFEMAKQGMSVKAIARKVGYSATAIGRGIRVAREFGMEACR